MTAPVATIAGLAAATVALHVRDPHVSGSWGYCPLSLLGIYCPGCGGLRAVNDLTHGDLAGAASSNLLLLLLCRSPCSCSGAGRSTPGTAATAVAALVLTPPALAVFAVVTLVFVVARNLPGSWLAP